MKAVLTLALTLACVAGVSYGDGYSTGFEVSSIDDLAAEGWVWEAFTPNLTSTQAHSGSTALLLYPRVWASFPTNGEFGTLNLWVYDAGMIPTADLNGPQWGLAKGNEAIGGHFLHRARWMDSAVAYGANPGIATNPLGQCWYSSTWLDAGDPADRSRGVAGWMEWEIKYNSNGTIEINLLTDPNGGGAKAFGSNTVGEDAALDASSLEFVDPGTGGADSIYLFGSWANDPNATPTTPFGNLIVDDLTWTPEDVQPCIAGDANCDGVVNIDDFVALKNGFGSGSTWAEGDFDGNGVVNIDDFVILKNHFGDTAVPEPATMSLLALGGLAAIRRRK